MHFCDHTTALPARDRAAVNRCQTHESPQISAPTPAVGGRPDLAPTWCAPVGAMSLFVVIQGIP
jgi:hypothetical protein